MAVLGRRAGIVRSALGALTAAAVLAAATPGASQGATSLEYAVKANYLYKFTPFVEWPANAFAAPNSPFNLCVLGQDPFGGALDSAVRGRTVGDHPVQVRRLSAPQAAADCHLLFAGANAPPARAQEALHAVAGRPTLTVTDGRGGMIRFVMEDGRVRFDVDAAAAAASGIGISSKLLALAVLAPEDSAVRVPALPVPPMRIGRLKITPLVALALAVALLAAGVALALFNEHLGRAERIRQATTQAEILAASVAAPLAFDDAEAAREYANALRANPDVREAGAYGVDGALVAGYAAPGTALPPHQPRGDRRPSTRETW